MKACIITLIGYQNYGNRLQHFALKTLLQDQGIETISWSNVIIKEEIL